MHEQLLVNVDSLLANLKLEDTQDMQTITINFNDYRDLFTLPTEDQYTIRNLDPNILTLQYVNPTDR